MSIAFRSHHAPMSKLQRRARDLMSLASLSAFAAGLGWLMIAFGLAITYANKADSRMTRMLTHFHWLPSEHADYRMLALAWLLGCAATLAPLLALRRLGKSLWQGPALSVDTARRFRALAHALLLNLVGGAASAMLASTRNGQLQIGFGLGTWGLLVAILLAYIVAELIREGAMAAVENREFV